MKSRSFADRARDAVLVILALVTVAQIAPRVFAAWDQTKPANNSALVSSEIRSNWASLQTALGNPDTTPLTIKQADIAALSRFGDAPTYKPGSDAAYDATISGLLSGSVDTTQRANGTTVETTLSSYSLPANVLSVNGKSVRITFWGTFAANANTKTLKLKFGATVLTFVSSAVNNSQWMVTAVVIRTGAATQKAAGYWGAVGNLGQGQVTSAAETLSGAVTITTTGQSSAASSDVLQEGFFVEVVG